MGKVLASIAAILVIVMMLFSGSIDWIVTFVIAAVFLLAFAVVCRGVSAARTNGETDPRKALLNHLVSIGIRADAGQDGPIQVVSSSIQQIELRRSDHHYPEAQGPGAEFDMWFIEVDPVV